MAPSSSTPSRQSRRLTRSQTASVVLGKRTGLSRSSSVASNRSAVLMTPESTPKKRARKSLDDDDNRANKENIPPEFLPPPSPTPSRLSRRSSFSSDISTVSTLSRNSVRRSATYSAIPQTASSLNLTFATPPPTPLPAVPLYLCVRGLLRATSDANHSMSMEGREAECAAVESFLRSLDGESDVEESVLYISGSPGTGKTALVNSIIASTNVSDGVKVLLINCMTITNMDVLWTKLAEELGTTSTKAKAGRHGSSKKLHGKDKVHEIFEKQGDIKCLLVLDELDNLATTSSNDLQLLFSLAASHTSKLRIMGIANTHTLTSSSILSSAERKDLKVKTIHFSPYSPTELLSILNKRFEDLPQDELKKLLPTPALTLLTKKVSALTGDVRVLFEVLRGAINFAFSVSASADVLPGSPAAEDPSKVSISPANILAALKAHAPSSNSSKAKSGLSTASSGNSEIVAKVRGLGLQQRLVLLAIVLASRRASAKLLITGSSSSFSSITPPATPTKKRSQSPMKRSSSSISVSSSGSDGATTSGINGSQLYSYYSALLAASDTHTVVSRSEFSDLLGILETTGLVALSAASTRSLKRSSSFAGSMKSNSAGTAQTVALQGHVRECEVVRGLGISAEPSNNDDDGDAIENGVRSIWSREMSRIRREAKAKDTLAMLEGFESFEDAVQL